MYMYVCNMYMYMYMYVYVYVYVPEEWSTCARRSTLKVVLDFSLLVSGAYVPQTALQKNVTSFSKLICSWLTLLG